ncbi:MAG: hypothetical protein ACR2NN_29110 [Bryobacteraceae bacterium]
MKSIVGERDIYRLETKLRATGSIRVKMVPKQEDQKIVDVLKWLLEQARAQKQVAA